MNDFMTRCKVNKTAMISLIKAGAFDDLWSQEYLNSINLNARQLSMIYYLRKACEPKAKLTLSNLNGLIQAGLVPDSLRFEKKTYHLNKILKAIKRGEYYLFGDELALQFYKEHFDPNELEVFNNQVCIKQKTWDTIYKNIMDTVRDWLKENQEQILEEYNALLFTEVWDKYAKGTVSAWEMSALCFYYGNHELKDIDIQKYGIVDFNSLDSKPVIAKTFTRNGKQIPIYKIFKIAGTVISKNDTRNSINLLTTTGIVNVKFTKDYFALFNRQISEIQPDGTKKVMEKGWFTRGEKLLVQGYRREDTFVAKTYTNTPGHQLYKITSVNGKEIELTHDRYM